MADKIKITLKGDKELIARMTNRVAIQRELQQAGEKSGAVVHKRAATYPTQRPGSRYRRTRRLGNSWAFKVKPYASGVRTFVENPVEYAPDVMDPTEQAPIHQGRWATTRDILEEKKGQIVGFFEEARDRIIRKLRG